MSRLRTFLVAVSIVLTSALPAAAHGTSGYRWWPSIGEPQRKRIVRLSHRIFNRHTRAHWTLDLFDCESQFRWWYDGFYDGLSQMNDDAKRTYGWGWRVKPQIKATKRMYQARGGQPWPNCP